MTEKAPDERLRDYGLIEHTSASYPPRTRANVQQSDGTVILGILSCGTKLTLTICEKERKPYLVSPTAEQLRARLVANQIRVSNVAGSRGSNLSTEQIDEYRELLIDGLG